MVEKRGRPKGSVKEKKPRSEKQKAGDKCMSKALTLVKNQPLSVAIEKAKTELNNVPKDLTLENAKVSDITSIWGKRFGQAGKDCHK